MPGSWDAGLLGCTDSWNLRMRLAGCEKDAPALVLKIEYFLHPHPTEDG